MAAHTPVQPERSHCRTSILSDALAHRGQRQQYCLYDTDVETDSQQTTLSLFCDESHIWDKAGVTIIPD